MGRQPNGSCANRRHGVTRDALASAAAAPLIRFDDTAGQDRTVRFEALPDDFEAELVETAERGQVRASEGSVRHVEVFRMGGVGTSILGRPRRLSGDRRADPLHTLNCEEPDYDTAIEFFTGTLGFVLAEDSPSLTTDGRPKRWVVVRPPDGGAGLVLARADSDEQTATVGHQFAGRVGLFLRVDDFDGTLSGVLHSGCTVVRSPRDEAYGRVCVFEDPWGNFWDLLGAPAD